MSRPDSDVERSAELIGRLLADPELRRRFRADPANVLLDAGLPQLAAGVRSGDRSLMTLELRESRSSLAGVLVAAAAEGVDFVQFAEHAARALAHDAGTTLDHALHPPAAHPAHPAHPAEAAPAKDPATAPTLGPEAQTPPLAPAPHPEPAPHPTAAAPAQPAAAPAASSPAPASATPASSPARSAELVTTPGQPGPPHAHHAGSTHTEPTAGASLDSSDPVLAYPGDAASPQAIAAWMGANAQRAGLPPELPVMAALTESGLRNLSYGDRDSVGFFQMRLGIWDEGPYAGYPDHPELQIQWFIDHALAVRSENPALAQSPDSWGEWVADVEQPAAQYRYRYQLQLASAQELLRGAELAPAAGSVAPVSAGQAALDVALHLSEHRAAHPGTTFQAGISPAGLVQYAYARQDIQLPPVAAEQFDVGIPVARDHLRPGDAVFFSGPDGAIDRVGLYAGHGRFVTAAPGGGHVRVASLDDPDQAGAWAGARRYTAQALGNPSSYARPLPTVSP